MRDIYFLFIACFISANSYAQCPGSTYCYIGSQYYEGVVDVINYPKILNNGSDLIFDLKISLPSCVLSYTGDIIILKIGGAGQNRNLDTINASITSGTSTILPNLLYPQIYLNEGITFQNGDSTAYAFDVIFKDVCSGYYLDASPPIINIFRTNCSAVSNISLSGITLSSNSSINNKWFLNDTLIPGAINQTYNVLKDGKYKLDVFDGITGCHNLDSVGFQGITYNGTGLLTAPIVGGATYTWYLNGVIIPGANINTYTASVNGNYEVVIFCSSCRLMTSITSRFSKEVNNLVTDINNNSNTDVDLTIYPNPFENILHIGCPISIKSFTIYNSIGQSVFNGKASDQTVELSSLPKGIYILVLTDNNHSIRTTHITKQ